MAISAIIFEMLLPMKKSLESIHFGGDCMVGCQNPSIGVQEKIETRTRAIPHMTTNTMMVYEVNWKALLKIRR